MSFLPNPAVFDTARISTLTPRMRLMRPKALITAAQAGLAGWRRNRDLPRALGQAEVPEAGLALAALSALEGELDFARRSRLANYDLQRHILVLIAILAERALLAERPEAPAISRERASRARL